MAITIPKTTKEILENIDSNRLNTEDLEKVVRKLISTSNKRIKRLWESEESDVRLSPAIRGRIIQSVKNGSKLLELYDRQDDETIFHSINPYFSIDKSKKTDKYYRNYLLTMYSQLKNFLEYRTSTITGAKSLQEEFRKRISEAGFEVEKLGVEDTKNFWKAYNRSIEKFPLMIEGKTLSSTEIQRATYFYYQQVKDVDAVVDAMKDIIRWVYEDTKRGID